jgi:hypothetical protein
MTNLVTSGNSFQKLHPDSLTETPPYVRFGGSNMEGPLSSKYIKPFFNRDFSINAAVRRLFRNEVKLKKKNKLVVVIYFVLCFSFFTYK